MLVYHRGDCGNTMCCLFAHLLVCLLSPMQVWSQCLVVQEPSWFLSVTWCGEALGGLGVQGVEALIPLGAFFSAKCSSRVPAKFLIYGAHTVCLCILVTIMDLPKTAFNCTLEPEKSQYDTANKACWPWGKKGHWLFLPFLFFFF
jgi:hypothetical protein